MALNSVRDKPLLALFGLLLVLYSLGIFTSQPPQEEELVLAQSKDIPFETLAEVATYLRANDTRIVRPSPSDETWNRQESDACGMYLEQAYSVLNRQRSTNENDLRNAVEVITLCTTDRPKNRAKLSTAGNEGVPAGVVSLLEPTFSYTTNAAAAECIWISSFASKPNHDAFVTAGAVERLSSIITNDCSTKGKEATSCFLAQMWAGAALQNLAAAYCTGSSGRCKWEWKREETNGRHEVEITTKHVEYNPEEVRLTMIRNTKLLDALTHIIFNNVPELEKGPSERTWPSRAQVTDVELSPSVATWGAIGTVRNLALSPEFYNNMPHELQKSLCSHAIRSPDWLENSKADEAIYRLGFDKYKECKPWYDRTKCSDYKDWVDEDGEPCRTYERKRWCAEYRDYVPEKGGDKYVTAGKACCACGGGNKKERK